MTIDTDSETPILYIDMDSVLVDFDSGLRRVSDADRRQYPDDPDEIPGIFALMDPMPGAIDAFTQLSRRYDTYILSTASWRTSCPRLPGETPRHRRTSSSSPGCTHIWEPTHAHPPTRGSS